MKLKKIVEEILFSSKWLLIPFYLVLCAALAVYTYFDITEFIEYCVHLGKINKETAMLTFIELIDMTMIANLGKQLITGSYHSFVSKKHGQENENASSGMLKVKMGSSLVGITSISLLKLSIEFVHEHVKADWDDIFKVSFVHGVFLVSVIILAVVDFLHEKSESFHNEDSVPPSTSPINNTSVPTIEHHH